MPRMKIRTSTQSLVSVPYAWGWGWLGGGLVSSVLVVMATTNITTADYTADQPLLPPATKAGTYVPRMSPKGLPRVYVAVLGWLGWAKAQGSMWLCWIVVEAMHGGAVANIATVATMAFVGVVSRWFAVLSFNTQQHRDP
eukprot:CAMPEP_0119356044 /NCGR_PEP_ID=MMETSP1334-20130426/4770_1 /TAXON_ID=127549 /ORGANISM="Calcidiscus leptoporus, Strain RCC1130" /LENGTH=139 /DNA_ID=CAMNT_0007370003 /DNA_START=286 /DNA_END=703 /DNA_ORIENTATION=+